MPHYTYLNQFSHILYTINLILSLHSSIEHLSSSLALATITQPFTTTTILPLLIALSFGHLVPILVWFDTHWHTSVQPRCYLQHDLVTPTYLRHTNKHCVWELVLKLQISIHTRYINAKLTLWEWQRLAGWLNWSFNIFPLLKPALNNFYAKISEKDSPNSNIWVNNAVREDLQWASTHIRNSSGVCLLRTLHWETADAERVVYCDTCLEGMAFWYPQEPIASSFYSPLPLNIPEQFILHSIHVPPH